MKKLLITSAVLCFCLSPLFSQEMKPKKFEDTRMVQITMMKFQPGKMDRAKEIISNYYIPASEKSQTPQPTVTLDMMTGEWDMLVLWEMDISDLEWEVSPDGIKWYQACMEIVGGAEKASEIEEEFGSLVARSTTHMARHVSYD